MSIQIFINKKKNRFLSRFFLNFTLICKNLPPMFSICFDKFSTSQKNRQRQMGVGGLLGGDLTLGMEIKRSVFRTQKYGFIIHDENRLLAFLPHLHRSLELLSDELFSRPQFESFRVNPLPLPYSLH